MPPLLITSSVHAYAPFVELTDCEERISLTLEALEKWLAMDRGLNVVLCDGSSFDFSERIKTRFPEAEIECLFFENDQDGLPVWQGLGGRRDRKLRPWQLDIASRSAVFR